MFKIAKKKKKEPSKITLTVVKKTVVKNTILKIEMWGRRCEIEGGGGLIWLMLGNSQICW